MPPALQDYLRDMANLRNGVLPPLPANLQVNRGTRFFVFTHLTGIHLLARIFARTVAMVRQSCDELLDSINIIIEADVVNWLSQLNHEEQAEAMWWALYFLLTPFGIFLWLVVFPVILGFDIAQFIVVSWAKGVAILTRWAYAQLRAMPQRLLDLGIVLSVAIKDTVLIVICGVLALCWLVIDYVKNRVRFGVLPNAAPAANGGA